ncbi:sensor histidine kinase [Candidatus Venteria ishoeyi]|uniref:histidine kinase n=1 Tax=Candidatus Venteria ishoeyi TaxID=1899563 RepID=A0A1H6FDW3_9GAMM|nr:ATP-binding protein [Candidatus Venteria ishoeyi]MDM8545341.1 ATP-binding protein [Candidatus Venteria ishoeyi]SEH07225.1 Signal transduction histidine-protein kinase BarA [Candidatus Venteria ishoeyi]
MKKSNLITKQSILIVMGFTLILLALVFASNISLQNLRAMNQNLSALMAEHQSRARLLNRVYDLIHTRIRRTYYVVKLTDPTAQKTAWEQYRTEDKEFHRNQQQLLKMALVQEERDQLEAHHPIFLKIQDKLNEAITLAMSNQREVALDKMIKIQSESSYLLNELSSIRDMQLNFANHPTFKRVDFAYQETQQQIRTLNIFAILLCIAVVIWIIYRIIHQEIALEKAVAALKSANETLETKVAERTATLQTARDQSLEADQSKSRFLANMSHELRTPLNAIIGYINVIQDEHDTLPKEESLTLLQQVNDSGLHLLSLVDDILDISKLEAGQMQMNAQFFSLPKLISDLLKTLEPLIIRNQNRFNWEYLANAEEMFADPVRVKQILCNLLSNAGKFTQNGQVTLTVIQQSIENRTWITMTITDTGIGISDSEQQRLFQPFMQVDNSSTRRYGGNGLGLVISLRFCQMMGGSISIESEQGKGSSFSVRLPMHARINNYQDSSVET